MIDPAATFGRIAAHYERSRPGYPEAAVDLLVAELGMRPGTTVVDVGAGTGKLTRQLAASGADLVGVEPSAGMREGFAAILPGVPLLDGTAEALPLADDSADAIVAAQAFHWFDTQPALDEAARVLRPGGTLAMIWNGRCDDEFPWREIIAIRGRYVDDTPVYRAGDNAWLPVLAADERFGPVHEATFPHEEHRTGDEIVARVQSTSVVADLPDADRAALLAEVRNALAPAAGGPIQLGYVTEVYWTRLAR